MTEQQKFEAWSSIYQMRPAGWTEACWNAWQARASQDRSAELLEALVDVLGWFPGRAAWHTDEPMKAVERARAAISKTRGE